MSSTNDQTPFRVAIIGGGMGGATAAYYLRELFGTQVGITLFEQSGRIGGRMRTETFAGKQFETGASIFHSSNRYMKTFANKFNLKINDFGSADSRPMFYNGNGRIVFSTLGGPSFLKPFRLMWRYGIHLLRVKSYTKSLVKDFSKIYTFQDEGQSFSSTADLMEALSPEFVEMTKWTYGDWLSKKLKVSDRLKKELAYGLISNNYCQDLSVHAFVGFISMATISGDLASVEDGNQHIPERLVKSALQLNPQCSPKEFVHAHVDSISHSESRNSYMIEYRPHGSRNKKQDSFDYVILATPMHQRSSIQAHGKIRLPSSVYVSVDRTYFHGKLKCSAFGIRSDSILPSQTPMIFPTQTGYLKNLCEFRILGSSPNNKEAGDSADRVWTTFSNPQRVPNPEETIAARYIKLTHSDATLKFNWLAYPVYRALDNPQDQLGHFVVAPRLYYANAIEHMASCMEIAAIGGRNVALLVKADRTSQPKIRGDAAVRDGQ